MNKILCELYLTHHPASLIACTTRPCRHHAFFANEQTTVQGLWQSATKADGLSVLCQPITEAHKIGVKRPFLNDASQYQRQCYCIIYQGHVRSVCCPWVFSSVEAAWWATAMNKKHRVWTFPSSKGHGTVHIASEPFLSVKLLCHPSCNSVYMLLHAPWRFLCPKHFISVHWRIKHSMFLS